MKNFVYYLTKPFELKMIKDEENIDNPNLQEICTKTLYSAISPGTELSAYKGDPPLRPTNKIYPRLQGYCNVSQITSIGSDITKFKVGDYILTNSSHRSNDTISANEIITRIPKNTDLVSISTTYLFHLGYNACLKSKMTPGHNVAIVGLGTLGLTSAAVANIFGASTFGFTNNLDNKTNFKNFGFRTVFSKNNTKKNNIADIVIITSNAWDDWELALRLAKPGGKIAVIGFPGRGQDKPKNNPIRSEYFYDKQLNIISCGYSPNQDVPEQDIRFTLKRNCQYLMSSIIEKKLPAKELITEIRDSKELCLVYEEMINRRSHSGTYVLDWT